MRQTTLAWLFVAILGAAPPSPGAEPTAQDRGWAIAREADRRSSGFGDSTANLRMILRNKRGQTSERELRIRTLERRVLLR